MLIGLSLRVPVISRLRAIRTHFGSDVEFKVARSFPSFLEAPGVMISMS